MVFRPRELVFNPNTFFHSTILSSIWYHELCSLRDLNDLNDQLSYGSMTQPTQWHLLKTLHTLQNNHGSRNGLSRVHVQYLQPGAKIHPGANLFPEAKLHTFVHKQRNHGA